MNSKSVSLRLFALVFYFLITLSWASARETTIAVFSSDINSEKFHLILEDNQENRILTTFYLDSYSEGTKTKRETLPMNVFINEGVTLPRKGKFVFARIYGENFDKQLGGDIIMDTLYNALTGKRKSYDYTLAQSNNGWSLFYQGRKTTEILAVANRVPILGPVGVKELRMK